MISSLAYYGSVGTSVVIPCKKVVGSAALMLLVSLPDPAAATTYMFKVVCQNSRSVAQWDVGAIDPGREWLRVATGTHYPGCQVSNFDEKTDRALVVDKHSGAEGVVSGIPLIGGILGHLLF